DEVIRREFRQMEGGWHSTTNINRSRQRVDRLFFFNEVNIETPSVPEATDQVDININVVEKPTGAIMFGAGFSDREGIILNGSVSQNNIFGTGNFFSLQVNTGRINRTAAVSFTNPYFTVDGVSLGVDIFQRNLNTRRLSRFAAFRTKTLGTALRLGIPIAENDMVAFGIGAEQTTIGNSFGSPQRNIDFVEEFGKTTNNFPATVSWARDRRDSAIYTTSGTTHRLFGEISVPGGDLNYYKISYNQKWFYPLTETFTLLLNGELGIGNGYAGKPLPFFKNFFAGGNNSVRGYDLNSLGPRDENGLSLGGSKRVVGNIEVLFPMPFMREDRSLRLSGFLDGGTVFAGDINTSDLRYSAGIAVTWVSPMGPLKVSLARPLNDKPGDNLQVFQFQFGQRF
ncbi:MAG: outer membrane protein assembly factor BamA, partial [Nitrosomonas sp.]|nr:outer membrane protein assembly factor BamA [Nitrosomonas sp.]